MLEVKFKHLFLDIDLKEKNSFVILGPNGSGKSILLRVIIHELHPQKLFKREVFGKVLTLQQARETFGVVNTEMEYFYKNENITAFDAVISAFKNAYVVYKFYEFTEEEINKTLEVLEYFQIHPTHSTSTLSLGEIKKLLIARAIVHNPKILCLDEPTNGLDIKAKIKFWDTVAKLNKKMILITHDFSEINNDFKHILHLKEGQIIKRSKKITKKDIKELFDLTKKELKALYG